MAEDLKITIIQSEIIWEDIEANIEMFDKKVDSICEKTDLIILPEMFTTGFTMNAAKLAEGMDGFTVEWLKRKSKEKDSDIAGTLIIEEDGKFFNRFVWADKEGGIISYDKKHLFTMAGEDKIYTPGRGKIVIDLKGWRIAPFICYDLRFPIWSRNSNAAYDVALYAANWPDTRSYAWKILLCARAIENQSYVVGINRTGIDGNGILYSGGSGIIDSYGRYIFDAGEREIIYTQTLELESLYRYRKEFPVLRDMDSSSIFDFMAGDHLIL